jgi:hypothetical protein
MACLLGAIVATLPFGNHPVCGGDTVTDRAFVTIDQPSSPWQTKVEPDGLLRLEHVDGFEGRVLHVRNSSCSQTVDLSGGLYEVAAIGWGSGEVILSVEGLGERALPLGKTRATYGYLFESAGGATSVSVSVKGDGYLRAFAIHPATLEQVAAWQCAQESIRQFGFATVSPQRAAPGVPQPAKGDHVTPLAAMTEGVVIDEPLMNTGHSLNQQRLVTWLCGNGLTGLGAEALGEWMRDHVKNGTAYGSVAILCRGISPANILEGPKQSPLWLQYLRAGGRIVHVGDLPFQTFEYASVKPLMPDANERGLGLLGLDAGWHSPFWGKGDRPVTRTRVGEEWGFENVDSSITGFPIDAVSIPFGTFETLHDKRVGASAWFRNVRGDAPWSGLVKIRQYFDGNDDSALRDVWRAAHYVGRAVSIPQPPPPNAAVVNPLQLEFSAGDVLGRHRWTRGESIEIKASLSPKISADAVRYEFRQGERVLLQRSLPFKASRASISLDTSVWALGDYEVAATAMSRGRPVATTRTAVGIHHAGRCDFPWMAWHQAGPNDSRNQLEFRDIRQSNMEVLLTRATPADIDSTVREGMGFALRVDTDLAGDNPPDYEQSPECFRLDPAGKPIATAYSGGRPSLGISHARVRKNAVESIRRPIEAVGSTPAFRPFVLCNDDYSIYYGWDYSPTVVAAFQREKGRPAPRQRPAPPPPGRVADDDAWLEWFRWTLENVDGGLNRALTVAATSSRPDVRIGPIPGAMQIPFVSLTEPAQYPPYHFGPNGFNLVASYYYNTFWQPVMTTSFWMEVGRMGNRTLPQWNMPDVLGTAGYTRNNLYHYLLGGVDGLAYYRYSYRTESAWEEIRRQGRVIRRIGPVQSALEARPRDIALLNSFTCGCFDPAHTLNQTYAYHNLMQAHYDVSVVLEEEVDTDFVRDHSALVLTRIRWLSSSAYDAIAKHAEKGGLVILDASVPFDIPGARRLTIDLSTGIEGEIASHEPPRTPGLDDYGRPERVRAVARQVSRFLRPCFECDDIRLVAARFAAFGYPHTWFVNALDGEEFSFCRAHAGAGYPGSRTPEKIAALNQWEKAVMDKGPFQTTVHLPTQTGTPYDLVSMSRVPLKRSENTVELSLSMDRFGGALVTWLPAEIQSVRLAAPPRASLGETVAFTATCAFVSPGTADREAATSRPMPFELVLRDPDGRNQPPSGIHMANDGVLSIEWTPARNDATGMWTVAVRELFSGLRASGVIEVTQ